LLCRNLVIGDMRRNNLCCEAQQELGHSLVPSKPGGILYEPLERR
jgi:hypothetical protein